VEAAMETAVRLGADMVLLQEPRGVGENDSIIHDSFRWIRGGKDIQANCGVAVSKVCKWRVVGLKHFTRECENYAQGSSQSMEWKSGKRRDNASFWEGLIQGNQLVVWNTENGTRHSPEANNHSIN
jgi:hypothetical protein